MTTLTRWLSLTPLLLLPLAANAHEGHGIEGVSHWHATDAAGLVALVTGLAVGLWLAGRK
jgi:hypothetical protein